MTTRTSPAAAPAVATAAGTAVVDAASTVPAAGTAPAGTAPAGTAVPTARTAGVDAGPAAPAAGAVPAGTPSDGAAPAADDPGPRLRLIRYEPVPGEPPLPPPRPVAVLASPRWETGPTERAVRPAAARVLRLALEVLDGRRPATQLAADLDPRALRYLRAVLPATRPALPSRLLRLVLCVPATGAAEVSAVCRIGGRVRALAARFERSATDPARWRCTVLRLG